MNGFKKRKLKLKKPEKEKQVETYDDGNGNGNNNNNQINKKMNSFVHIMNLKSEPTTKSIVIHKQTKQKLFTIDFIVVIFMVISKCKKIMIIIILNRTKQ